MFAVVVVLLNALSFASLAYVVNRKEQHATAALLAAGACPFRIVYSRTPGRLRHGPAALALYQVFEAVLAPRRYT